MRKFIDWKLASILAVATVSASACGAGDGGGLGGLGDLAEQCGLTCPAKGIVEGNASISGVANVDAFFGAVVNFSGKANAVANGINGRLAAIKASLALDANATPAQIKAAMIAKFHLDANAGVKVVYQPAKCNVSAKATIEATAKCDASVTPGSVSAKCEGTCKAEGMVAASCDANADVVCTGTAPNLACEGECNGTCEATLDVAATCEGTCRGTCTATLDVAAACEGTCTGTCEGTCTAEDGQGNCQGKCDGTCQGTCEVKADAGVKCEGTCSGSCEAKAKAGVECQGKCKGECTYTPPNAECQADAQIQCKAKANATVECKGECSGEVTPPKASAECEASAKADASLNVDCTPPSIDVQVAFAANLDAEAKATAQADFEAFLVGFKANFAGIVAELGRADVVLKAGASLGSAATGAVKTSVSAAASGKVDLKSSIGLGCAVAQLGQVAGVISGATSNLSGSVAAAGSLTAELGG